ncbi:MAG: zinc ribbon domain-containing protein [Lachnospiraceae bacterium]|nr:zinc ribbon domain-containing protein [Lachnospiraceae bacterium]
MFCPKCGSQIADGLTFCPECGANLQGGAAAAGTKPHDHTAEMDAKDVADNKVYAVLMYLCPGLGHILALLAGKDSAYLKFHSHQSLKMLILFVLLAFAAGVLAITIIVPIACGLAMLVLLVVYIIAVIQTLMGKSVEAPIVRELKFL